MPLTLADAAVIVYNEDGSINRESFGRVLSPLEKALCDALDKRNTVRWSRQFDPKVFGLMDA